ncbi:hypothetical protein LNQ52_21195 [Klebsiella pneumoniae subsp. pneumoniae]|nr:hypothetical protein [Klebsiella pneumoniae subsp. pneumoniae]
MPHNRVPLDKGRREVLKHVHRLWGSMCCWSSRTPTAALELLDRCSARPNAL